MLDHAITLGRLPLWTYPVWVSLALVCALAWALWRAPRAGISRRGLLWRSVAISLAGVLAAKLGHLLLEARGHTTAGGRVIHGVIDLLRVDPWHFFRFADGGYVLLPGMIGGALILWLLLGRSSRDGWRHADLLAPASFLGLAIGRIACLLVGCCHGRPSTLPWALRFEGGPSLGMGFVHPTQVYASLWAVLLFVLFSGLWRRSLRTAGTPGMMPGTVSLLAILSYSLGRMAIESWRGDLERGFWLPGGWSSSQIISAALALLAFALLLRRRLRRTSLGSTLHGEPLREVM